MTETLYTRDGLVGNSPRYQGYTSPPYQRYLKDDSGAILNLTGVGNGAFTLTMVNQSNPMLVKTGGGSFRVVSPATQGLIAYTYAQADLDDAGNWWLFLTVQIPGESGQRAFDPDLLCITTFPGGFPIVSIQEVDLEQLGGTQISSSNPVPISGPITAPDGAIVAIGTTTDSSTANTQIGLLKAIKAYLAGTLTTSGITTETNSAAILADANSIVTATANTSTAVGTQGDAAWSGSGNGSEIALLKKLVAELAGTLGIQQADLSTTGTISAAQSTEGTPVSNATVVLAVGLGQSTWKAQLLAGGGGFTSGTTVVADKSADGGTTWYSASFKVSGMSPSTPVSSITGPGPVEMTGDAAGVSHVRIRCSVLNSTETVAVTLRASAGVSDVGLISSIPSGTNLIGSTTSIPQASTTGTITSVASANSSTQLLASNVLRKGMSLFNDSTAVLYLALAGSASTTAYTTQIPANTLYEMPTYPLYTGAIYGIWASATGNARITEMS